MTHAWTRYLKKSDKEIKSHAEDLMVDEDEEEDQQYEPNE